MCIEQKSTLQNSKETDGRGGGCCDLSEEIKGYIVLVALMRGHDSLAVCGLCPRSCIISIRLELCECDSVNPDVFTHLLLLNELSFLPSLISL